MFRFAMGAWIVLCSCAWAASGADQQKDPQTARQERVDRLVAQLGSASAQQRLGAEVLLCSMGADGFPLIEAASKHTDLKPDVAAALAQIVERERPRFLARLCRQKARDATWKWNERTALAAYDKVGKKNPKWDALARAGIKQFVTPGGVAASRASLEKAIEAGCDDPLILYLESRCVGEAGETDLVALESLCRTAAESMLASNYPASRKCLALKNYTSFVSGHTHGKPDTAPGGPQSVARGAQFLSEALKLWPQFVKEPGVPEEYLYDVGATVFKMLYTREDGPRRTFEILYPSLKDAFPNSPFPLRFEAAFYVDYAWFARGHGYASTVTPEGLKLMNERVALAETDLTKAWEMDPDDPAAAMAMLDVELLQGIGRERMEMWYQRAMKADPDSKAAASYKMHYLEPKWYGSAEEMLAFGRELRDSKNHVGRLGNLLIDAHVTLSKLSSDPTAYFHDAQVWEDIRSVFEPYLAAAPDDPQLHSAYAFQACRCARWGEAKRQFELLGDKVVLRPFGDQATLDRYRHLAAENSAGAAP